jgi:hypothetical protein
VSNLGIGVLINLIGGRSEEEAKVFNDALGKTITSLWIDEEAHDDGSLKIEIWDSGRSCCESRFIDTDDTLSDFLGSVFRGVDIRITEPKDAGDEMSTTEEAFLLVHTSAGDFTVVTHNIHNGYYGGFYLRVRPL